ncbi:hypothetical protein ACGF5M_02335 [Gemmatimonadota bacterium]
MTTLRRILPIGLLAVLPMTACDGSSGPDSLIDEALLNYDVAVVSAEATLQNLDFMNAAGGGGIAGFIFPAPMDGPQFNCLQRDGLGGCQRAFHDGYTISRAVTFYDSLGVEQPAFDRLLTASMHIVFDVDGERERTNWSGSVERHRDMWVTGLVGEETERTWNGTGENSVLRSRHVDTLPARTYDMEGSSTLDDVVVPHPRTRESWPLSGTITREVHVEVLEDGEVVREADRTVVIVFDGTQYAEMTVNGETFTIDLAERRLKRGRRHGQGG